MPRVAGSLSPSARVSFQAAASQKRIVPSYPIETSVFPLSMNVRPQTAVECPESVPIRSPAGSDHSVISSPKPEIASVLPSGAKAREFRFFLLTSMATTKSPATVHTVTRPP